MERDTGILVLCTGNSCRSQMAAAFLRKHGGKRLEVWSAGTEPASEVHPLAIDAMREVGIDLAGARPIDYREYLGAVAPRYLITVCDGAARACPAVWPGVEKRLRWPFDDPAAFEGSDEEKLAGFRRVRDEIEARVVEWLEGPAASGPDDGTV